MKAQDKTGVGRRRLFRLLGAGVATGAIAPVTGEAKADSETADDKRKPRYRESAEVKTYYRVNRYPR